MGDAGDLGDVVAVAATADDVPAAAVDVVASGDGDFALAVVSAISRFIVDSELKAGILRKIRRFTHTNEKKDLEPSSGPICQAPNQSIEPE